MKNIFVFTIMLLMVYACKEKTKETQAENVSEMGNTESATQSEWITLFDGTSLDEWQAYLGGEVPKYWSIKDDALVFTPPTPEERKNAGPNDYNPFNIISKKEFTSFVLSLDWKISEAGNSGIFWGIYENEKYGEPYQTALEIQVLDNEKHPDGKNGTSHQAGALYDLVSPSEDVTKPVGEWNTFVITINHDTNKGSCELNGVVVSSFPVGGEELNAMLKDSKFDGWDGFAQYKTGKIGLQDHANIVSYRNIKIKEL